MQDTGKIVPIKEGGASPFRIDYSALDRPEFILAAFYPNRHWSPPPVGAHDYQIPVDQGVLVSSRYYPVPDNGPTILYFHGNAEVACEQDQLAALYNELGMGLFVADYRGFGLSNGSPSFSTMATDTDPIFRFFEEVVKSENAAKPLFVMGRSLGCISALEIASRHKRQLNGLIVDSGVANVAGFARRLGVSSEQIEALSKNISRRNQAIDLPALVIHGEQDSLIPVSIGIELHRELGSTQKQLVLIPSAGHNNIMLVENGKYFSAIHDFVFRD